MGRKDVRKRILSSTIALSLAMLGLVATPSPAMAQSCSSWHNWNYASSYHVIFRACVNSSSSTITAKTEAYLDWTGISNPQFDILTLTSQLYMGSNRESSDQCDRTPAANNPNAHNSPAEAMICLDSISNPAGSATWHSRVEVCIDPSTPDLNWTRCSADTTWFPPGWIESPNITA
jgi:hypothetical protein